MSIGLPVKLLHEAEGHVINLELTSGEVYRGHLLDAEDNMNCQLSDVKVIARDGATKNLPRAFIRGSKIRLIVVPEMLKNAPMFKRVDPSKVLGGGSGYGDNFGTGMGVGRGKFIGSSKGSRRAAGGR